MTLGILAFASGTAMAGCGGDHSTTSASMPAQTASTGQSTPASAQGEESAQ